MEGILGGLAFACVIAAQVFAVVAVQSAKHRPKRTNGESSPSCGNSRPCTFALVAVTLSLVIAGAPTTASAAESNAARAFSIQCANRHVHALTLIEYLGQTPDYAGDSLFKAGLAIIDARRVCAEGYESRALSLYDRAVLDLVFHDDLPR